MMHFDSRLPARNFGFHSDRTVLGFQPRSSLAPGARMITPDPSHVFDVRLFERLRLWWEWNDTSSPLYISGPTGCGKTTSVLQFLARLNVPVVTLTCRRRMDKYELVGQYGVDSATGGFRWYDGPASLAWRYGYVLVINEFSVAPAEVWVAANDILEGDALVIDRNAETIPRHPNARVVITDNCRCNDAGMGMYRGRNTQDMSVSDRFWHIAVDYIDPATEKEALRARTAQFAAAMDSVLYEKILEAAVRFAADTRKPQPDSTRVTAVSTRVLVRFVGILLSLVTNATTDEDILATALNLALAESCHESAAIVLHQFAHLQFAGVFSS